MSLGGLAKSFVDLLRKVDRFSDIQAKHGTVIEKLVDRVSEHDLVIQSLVSREEVLMERARSSAMQGANDAMNTQLSNLFSRIADLEAQMKYGGPPTPPPFKRLDGPNNSMP